jgi:uncharacterized protein (UPF0147 family)
MSEIRKARRELDQAVSSEIVRAQYHVRTALSHTAVVTRDAEMPTAVAAEWVELTSRLERLADELTGWAQRHTTR